MFHRLYCFVFVSISGLLFSLGEEFFWGCFFFLISFVPVIFSEKNKKHLYMKLFMLFLVFLLFSLYGTWMNRQWETSLTGEEQVFVGTIVSEANLTTYGQTTFTIELENGERLQAFSVNDKENFYFGDLCTFKGTLSEPKGETNPYGFNYEKYLRQQNIHWIVTITDETIQCKRDKTRIANLFLAYRKNAIGMLMDMSDEDDKDIASIISALVFGERGDVSEARLKSYQQLGIIHLLAVSGLHVGILTFSLFYLLCRIGITRERASLIIIALLPIYIIIAGAAPSVIRASMMSILFIAASFRRVRIKGIHIISVVCLVLIIYNPCYLFHLGFQLSFLTSFSLIISQHLFQLQRPILLTLTVTFVAQLISLPMILYHFFEVSLLTIPINLIFIPFVSIWILPLSYITALLITIFPPIAIVPYKVICVSLHVAHSFLDYLVTLDWDRLVFGRPSHWMMFAMFLSIIFLFIALERKRKKHILISISIFITLFFVQYMAPYFRMDATVTFLDVGQGDAAVIELAKNKGVYVIDTGGVLHFHDEMVSIPGPGKRVIEPYLKGRGIKKIDKLILTHGHRDHIGEACYIMSMFPVDEVYYPKGTPLAHEAKDVFKCVKDHKIPLRFTNEKIRWQEGKNAFFIIHPVGNEREENNRSIVLVAIIEGVSFLFTGDIEEEAEKRIIEMYPNLHADILKVAHHGSRTSSTQSFLQVVKPKVAVISAGKNNMFGHPHEEVVNRLKNIGAIVKTTNKNGAITVRVKNNKVQILERAQ